MTMRDLASAVGMEAASLYNHIKSKEDILKEICFSLGETYSQNMSQVISSNSPLIEKLEALITLHIKINFQSSSLASVLNDEWRHLNEEDKKHFLDQRHQYEDNFIHVIKEGIEVGVIRNLEPRIVLYTILSSMRWLFHWYYLDRPFEYDQVKETISEMIFKSILTSEARDKILIGS